MFKMMSFVMNMITTNNMGRILESTTDILEIMLGVFIVIIFMFMLFVTVVVSVGV